MNQSLVVSLTMLMNHEIVVLKEDVFCKKNDSVSMYVLILLKSYIADD